MCAPRAPMPDPEIGEAFKKLLQNNQEQERLARDRLDRERARRADYDYLIRKENSED